MAQKRRKLNRPTNPEAEAVIDALGQDALSRTLGVTQQAISLWKFNGIPKGWRGLLSTLHPHLFGADTGGGR